MNDLSSPERRRQERALATRMIPLARMWQRLADEHLAEFGVSNSAGLALIHLGRIGDDLRQGDLARAISVTEASLVRTIDQLERGGFVVRTVDPDDRRNKRLRLTAAGSELLERIEPRLADLRGELLAGVPEDELAVVVRVLDLVAARIAQGLAAERLATERLAAERPGRT